MQSPTAQQSWMEGLEGSAGFPPRREAGWGGRGSHLRESVRLSPPSWPHPPRHSWFSQTQEGQGRFLVFFHQRNREPCGAIKWPKIIPREKACLRPRTRGGLSTCFLWEENMKRKWIQSGRSENYKMNGMGFQRESKKKGKKIKNKRSLGSMWWRAPGPDLNSDLGSAPFARWWPRTRYSPLQDTVSGGEKWGGRTRPPHPGWRALNTRDLGGSQQMFSFSHPFPLSFPKSWWDQKKKKKNQTINSLV